MLIKGLLQTLKDTLKKAGHQLAAKEELLLTGVENEFTGLKSEIANLVQRVYNLEGVAKAYVERGATPISPLDITAPVVISTVPPASVETVLNAVPDTIVTLTASSGSGVTTLNSGPITKAQKLALKASVTPNVTA